MKKLIAALLFLPLVAFATGVMNPYCYATSGGGGGTPVLESWTENYESTSTATIAVSKPSGVASGDLLLILAGNDFYNAEAYDSLTGWTEWSTTAIAWHGVNASLFWRVADGTEGATETITISGSETARHLAYYLRISGADTTAPIDATGTWAYSTATASLATTAPSGGSASNPLAIVIGWQNSTDELPELGTGSYTEQDSFYANHTYGDISGVFGTLDGAGSDQDIDTATAKRAIGVQFEVSD